MLVSGCWIGTGRRRACREDEGEKKDGQDGGGDDDAPDDEVDGGKMPSCPLIYRRLLFL